MQSDAITVPARELGTSIPWSKIIKPESYSKRRHNTNNTTISTNNTSNMLSKSVSTASLVSSIPPTTAITTGTGTTTATAITGNNTLSTTSTNTSGILEDVVLTEGLEIINPNTIKGDFMLLEDSVTTTSDTTSTNNSECLMHLTKQVSQPPVTTTHTHTNTHSNSHNEENWEFSATEFSATVNKLNSLVDPNEPIFTGTKLYDEDFVFWQLIDWYKAGCGEPEIAPDLFGTVVLPLPSMCFGESGTVYDDKAKDCLVTILRNEKAQVLPWPAVLKNCFNQHIEEQMEWKHYSTSNPPSTPSNVSNPSRLDMRIQLMGSPSLDVTLGQVDAVHRVLKDLVTTNHKSTKGRHAVRNNQLDDILPPEMPTAWVQCELCHKWRRVAWHVDADTLPDLWECHMNFWDVENNNCQGRYYNR